MELSELIQSVNIVDYISQFVDLTQKGDEWWGLSCFKDENTPSFSVRENPPFWYDYSSGAGGNLYHFVKMYHHCSSREAVEIIKQYAGYDGNIQVRQGQMTTTKVCKRYQRKQPTAKQSKGVVLPDNYMQRYEKREDKLAVWEQEGISKVSLDKYQVYYDGFSDRLVYPIRNLDGKIVNIGGRTLDPQWKEKGLRKYTYFHSWGTMDVIYGLYDNIEAIQEAGEIIIFEGCKSVLLADTWGVHNTGAILTSHLNPRQMKQLVKLGCRVVFALDKEIRVREDQNIQKLKNYINVEYLWDRRDLLGEKESPVDRGYDTFLQLYNERLRLR